ncbi:MAG TPA: DUF5709 domain-containing protein [Propionibacteriaceae bacterium]|nr:DUF5709 domain-containing protein [Propionibacteriaceae bacterium]
MTDFSEDVPEQSEQLDLQPEEMLLDTGKDDMLDGGYEIPEHYSAGQGFGNTPAEMSEGETLDQRIAQEVPDLTEADLPTSPAADGVTENLDDLLAEDLDDGGEMDDDAVVRLVEPNEGIGEDTESELLGYGVSDTADQTAEEAAVHIVHEP